jgi:hypothetical protein
MLFSRAGARPASDSFPTIKNTAHPAELGIAKMVDHILALEINRGSTCGVDVMDQISGRRPQACASMSYASWTGQVERPKTRRRMMEACPTRHTRESCDNRLELVVEEWNYSHRDGSKMRRMKAMDGARLGRKEWGRRSKLPISVVGSFARLNGLDCRQRENTSFRGGGWWWWWSGWNGINGPLSLIAHGPLASLSFIFPHHPRLCPPLCRIHSVFFPCGSSGESTSSPGG